MPNVQVNVDTTTTPVTITCDPDSVPMKNSGAINWTKGTIKPAGTQWSLSSVTGLPNPPFGPAQVNGNGDIQIQDTVPANGPRTPYKYTVSITVGTQTYSLDPQIVNNPATEDIP